MMKIDHGERSNPQPTLMRHETGFRTASIGCAGAYSSIERQPLPELRQSRSERGLRNRIPSAVQLYRI